MLRRVLHLHQKSSQQVSINADDLMGARVHAALPVFERLC